MIDASPVLIMVIGVSGCGKSTVAKALAERLGYLFVEADDFHSAQNRQHMASGQALTDEMRAPWIQSLKDHIGQSAEQGHSMVLAYSGLRAAHRASLRELALPVITLFLDGDEPLIEQRMNARQNHFMPSTLLKSQFEALQDPGGEPRTFRLNINCTLQELLDSAVICITDQQIRI